MFNFWEKIRYIHLIVNRIFFIVSNFHIFYNLLNWKEGFYHLPCTISSKSSLWHRFFEKTACISINGIRTMKMGTLYYPLVFSKPYSVLAIYCDFAPTDRERITACLHIQFCSRHVVLKKFIYHPPKET